MAISSWMIWGRNLRTNRSQRHRQDHENSHIQLDLSKDLKDNIKEVLTNICLRHGVSSVKKLGYLNAIVRLVTENDSSDYGLTPEELFCCLRVGLIQEATQVRAAALRSIRYLLKKQEDVLTLNKLQYPYFIARSMDINLRNDMERMQALRLVRRILVLAPRHFSPVLARSLISLTNGGVEEKDRTFRAFLATLCELGVLNSALLISCGGVGTLARSATTGLSPAMVESVIGVLLRLLGSPETRSSVSLLCLAAPYCELHSSLNERSRESRESRFAASKLALLSVLRSYSGVLNFCNPHDNSGLKAIADILYVEQLEVRGAVLELLYELLGLPLPIWTDEPDVALAAVDPSRPKDNWRLSEGFVAAEGRSILPPLASHCPNITELHLALLVYVLLECGLHRALAETIVTSDTFISVRAAVLLGALLHLAHSLLPPDVCDLTPPLPNLLEHASVGRHQALAAVAILGRMHSMMRRRPAPSSLFLDRILQAGTWMRPSAPRRQRTSSRNWLRRESPTTPLLKDAQVLSSKDALAWNWPVIRSILRSREDSLRIFHDSDHRLFIKRLVRYFKPSSNRYSRVELGTSVTLAREATLAGCDLVNCLLEIQEPEGTRLLNELIGDIAEQISEITTQPSAHDCLFSPRHMTTTCCQKYFLFLGQLSQSAKGTVILKAFNLLEKMEDLAIATNHDCYVKLIISSLDYTREGPNRKVLSKIISSGLEQTRLYATQFLRLILRARMNDASQWALTLLTGRLSDDSRTVALAALEALHEASEEPEYLEIFLNQGGLNRAWDKWLEHLGDRGYLLNIRLYSLRAGFTRLPSPVEELERWVKPGGFAERYVGLIEGEIHDSFTRRQRGENGSYLRRQSSMLVLPRDVFIPPHLLGQLVQHELGMQLLTRRNVVQRLARTVQRFILDLAGTDTESNSKATKSSRSGFEETHFMSEESGPEEAPEPSRLETIIDAEVMETVPRSLRQDSLVNDSQRTTPEKIADDRDAGGPDERILTVKAALWSSGHYGTSPAGVEQLKHHKLVEMMTNLAESCQYYAVRATAMYSLSLISTTRAGADVLALYDWPCVRYRRGDYWPIVQPTQQYSLPSPVPIQKHHRSLSDGKPDLPDPIVRRTRNRSESAATDIEAKRLAFPERGETPSPVSSVQRLSQQDAEGYAKLRKYQMHRRPSFSHSSLEMYSSDGRLSLQSLSEFESSRSWTTDNANSLTPPAVATREEDPGDTCYMGICLPKNLQMIFPENVNRGSTVSETFSRCEGDNSQGDEEESSEGENADHGRICLVCYKGRNRWDDEVSEADAKIRKETLRHAQRLSNPVWYRHSRQALLRLRQRYPEKFQDTCLFSEVASRLGSGTYRLQARRFLQELFLDAPFDVLYLEPMKILHMPIGTEENLAQPTPAVLPSSDLSISPSKRRVNGRLTIPEVESPSSTTSELASETRDNGGRLKSPEAPDKTEKLSDEKIIAEILKPAERLRISKSSDNKLLKVTGTNTAISLD
ncbi:rapamycin-insensitive companion of mTOR [Diachasma alloeum]|uniref:rapamycin-insensitive companion of mTOR n=1 Tax=Diachasma alloeum TaxID=454923 RepID=UPI000738290F|nr:rapamycin-insensitive companion of mTOR [Diachasma alloeum]